MLARSVHLIDNCFKHHPIIIGIEQRRTLERFDFTKFSVDDLLFELNKLDHPKSTEGVSIKILEENSDISDFS